MVNSDKSPFLFGWCGGARLCVKPLLLADAQSSRTSEFNEIESNSMDRYKSVNWRTVLYSSGSRKAVVGHVRRKRLNWPIDILNTAAI